MHPILPPNRTPCRVPPEKRRGSPAALKMSSEFPLLGHNRLRRLHSVFSFSFTKRFNSATDSCWARMLRIIPAFPEIFLFESKARQFSVPKNTSSLNLHFHFLYFLGKEKATVRRSTFSLDSCFKQHSQSPGNTPANWRPKHAIFSNACFRFRGTSSKL